MSQQLQPTPDEQKLERRASRKYGLFAPHLMKAALKQSFVMLRPDIQWKNPVMFVVEIGTILSIIWPAATLKCITCMNKSSLRAIAL